MALAINAGEVRTSASDHGMDTDADHLGCMLSSVEAGGWLEMQIGYFEDY